MSSSFHLLGAAFLLGLVFNAAPGAVFAETIRRSLKGGYSKALRVQFGSLVGDATWAILGLAGIGILLQADILKIPVGVAGASYLAWLAFDSWRASLAVDTPQQQQTNTGGAASVRRDPVPVKPAECGLLGGAWQCLALWGSAPLTAPITACSSQASHGVINPVVLCLCWSRQSAVQRARRGVACLDISAVCSGFCLSCLRDSPRSDHVACLRRQSHFLLGARGPVLLAIIMENFLASFDIASGIKP